MINSILYIVRRKGTKSDSGDLVVTDVLKSRMVRYSSKSIESLFGGSSRGAWPLLYP